MAILDEIIDGSSDDSVGTPNLLRKALVVARRIEAGELATWVNYELNGYYGEEQPALPTYRGPFGTPVKGTYSGPYVQGTDVTLDPRGSVDRFADVMFRTELRQSVASLEVLAAADQDAAICWPPTMVGVWNGWERDGKVIHPQGMLLIEARQVLTRPTVIGVLDSVRTTLLTLALDLQAADSAAGESGGPTVTTTEVSQTVTQFFATVYGSGPVAIGTSVAQTNTISVGDSAGLISAVRAAGLVDDNAIAELTAAAHDEDKQSKLRAFVDKVGGGAYTFVSGVGGQVAKDVLTPLIEQFLGVKN